MNPVEYVDSTGGVMAIIAMSVVFSALILIFLVLKAFGQSMIAILNRKSRKMAAGAVAQKKLKRPSDTVAQELAAVAVALRLYQEELHIHESTVITINRASRVYSPWSSKIHGITAIPSKK